MPSRTCRPCRNQAAVQDFCLFSRGGGCFTGMSPKSQKGLQVFMTLFSVLDLFVSPSYGFRLSLLLWKYSASELFLGLSLQWPWKLREVCYLHLADEVLGFSREAHDTARKWAHDTVLDVYSFFGRVLGLQGWALPVLSLWGQCSLGMLSPVLNFQASLGASPRPVPILWFICSMSDQADYLSHCRCFCLPYQNLYLSTLL